MSSCSVNLTKQLSEVLFIWPTLSQLLEIQFSLKIQQHI